MSYLTFLIPTLLFSLQPVSPTELFEGDSCTTDTGIPGTCRSIHDCSSAQIQLRARGRPTTCSYEGNTPIVCCRDSLHQTTSVEPGGIAGWALIDRNPNVDGVADSNWEEGRRSSTEGPEVTKRRPGEAAAYWCAQYRRNCESRLSGNSRLIYEPSSRSLEENSVPENEDFGRAAAPNPATAEPSEGTEGRVVGGQEARRHEFPHMVAVGFGQQHEIRWECGGSLISDNFVLTAAHCLSARDGSVAEWVLLGATRVSDQLRGYSEEERMYGVVRKVVRGIRHPAYQQNEKYNDVALLELGPSLRDSGNSSMIDEIRPACLQVEWDENVRMATATGWGRLGYAERPSSSLQKVNLRILNNSICNETYTTEINLLKISRGMDDSMICAGDLRGGKDTCQGDSGGPLQQKTDRCLTHIIGVTSFGKICGFANSAAVYMRVSHFIPWIESVVWPE